jgi:hypothetical protein
MRFNSQAMKAIKVTILVALLLIFKANIFSGGEGCCFY